MPRELVTVRRSNWERLTTGDYGLAKTFWLAWFIPNWLLGAVVEVFGVMTGYAIRAAVTPEVATTAFMVLLAPLGLWLAYFGFSSFWTWRAAGKHPNGWAMVAKIWISISAGTLVLGLVLGILGS